MAYSNIHVGYVRSYILVTRVVQPGNGVFGNVPRPLGITNVTGEKRYKLLTLKGFYTQLIMQNVKVHKVHNLTKYINTVH